MEPFAFALMALFGGGAFLLGRPRHSERVRTWRIAAEAAGLTDLQESWSFGSVTAVAGRSEELRVRLSTYRRSKTESGSAIEIESTAHGLSWLRLQRETMGTAFEKRVLGAKEIELGDEDFDADFFVNGAPALVRAVFDAETRRTLCWLLGHVQLWVSDGNLRAELPERRFSRPTQKGLPEVLPRLIDVARRLEEPDDVPPRLADVALSDRLPAVRREALLVLTREYPSRKETREALRAGCQDPDPDVRIRAALASGLDGRPTLLELATSGPDVYAARAATILDPQLSPESCSSILENALRTRRTETARACLGKLGRIGSPESVPLVAKVLRLEEGELAVAAAAALGAIGLPAGEPPLVKALRWGSAVRVAAAEALGRFASVGAVLALKEAEAEPRPDDGFRRAARTAIARIQSRAMGASPGQLSLAAGESGQLSLVAGDETGQLSLPSGPHEREEP